MIIKTSANVHYEWDVETQSDGDCAKYEDGEIVEHNFCNSYAQAAQLVTKNPPAGFKYVVVLVRDDPEARSWAYVIDGTMGDYTEDAYYRNRGKIPKRFHEEIARFKDASL